MAFVELVQINTRDGVRLDGALQVPGAESGATGGGMPAMDAALFVHGTASNFYSSTLTEHLAGRFLSHGAAALRVNTRGHDGLSTAVTRGGPIRQGAAYELVDDCRHDLAGWLDFLRGRGYARIALVGHSLGALKAIYSQAREPAEGVARLVAISPPRLSHARFLASPWGSEFALAYREAEAHVAAGAPQTLMEIRHPLPYVVTAEGYLDKYHVDERYDVLAQIGQLCVPLLATFGSRELEGHAAFSGLPEAIEGLAPAAGGVPREVAIVAGADHFYAGTRTELAARIENWLLRLAAGAAPRG